MRYAAKVSLQKTQYDILGPWRSRSLFCSREFVCEVCNAGNGCLFCVSQEQLVAVLNDLAFAIHVSHFVSNTQFASELSRLCSIGLQMLHRSGNNFVLHLPRT